MKRRIAGLAACALVAVGLVVASQASTAGAETTVKLRLKESLCGADQSHCRWLNHNPKRDFGDTLIFSVPLKSRDDGQPAGRDEGECITMNKRSSSYYCSFVAHLKGNDIAVQGRLALEFDATSVLPITGGTGVYEGASGYWQQTGQNVVVQIVTP